MSAEQVAGIVRALMAGLGGIFVGQGWIDEKLATEVAGATAVLGAAIWSFIAKRRR